MTIVDQDEAKSLLKKARDILPFAAFLGYWELKAAARDKIHRLFAGYALISIFILALEVAAESGGPKFLKSLLDAIDQLPSFVRTGGFILFWGGFAVIAWHNFHAIKEKAHQWTSGDIIWAMFHSKKKDTELAFIREFLPLTMEPFRGFGAFRIAAWRHDGNEAIIPDGYIYSSIEGALPEAPLPIDRSVAGAVLKTGDMHYVPRFGFPFNTGPLKHFSAPFPHSIIFKIKQPKNQQPTINAQGIDRGRVYMRSDRLFVPDRAFIAVPLKKPDQTVFGALTIDFERTDPLAKAQLKTIAVLARLLAEELTTIANKNGHVPLHG